MQVVFKKNFANGSVYTLRTDDGFLVETTDTFLPYCTKQCNYNIDGYGDRTERWMIGVSVMSGCPVCCGFCATGGMKKYRNLSANEIVYQFDKIIELNREKFSNAKEHKVNYTRMGEPFLNIKNVREAIDKIEERSPGTHHYISTIGIRNSDFSWIEGNVTLQISLHSLNEDRRNKLIPYKNKMSIQELGKIRTKSNLKTTLNLTLVDYSDFDINILRKYFDPRYFFIKLSPINDNEVNKLGKGVVNGNYR